MTLAAAVVQAQPHKCPHTQSRQYYTRLQIKMRAHIPCKHMSANAYNHRCTRAPTHTHAHARRSTTHAHTHTHTKVSTCTPTHTPHKTSTGIHTTSTATHAKVTPNTNERQSLRTRSPLLRLTPAVRCVRACARVCVCVFLCVCVYSFWPPRLILQPVPLPLPARERRREPKRQTKPGLRICGSRFCFSSLCPCRRKQLRAELDGQV